MEVLSLTRIRSRFNELALWQKVMFAVIGFCILSWMIAFSWFMDPQTNEVISALQVDKIIHFLGGIFAAGLIFLSSGFRSKGLLFGLTVVIGILWEVWEVVFLPDQRMRLDTNFPLWLSDSSLDLVADFLGAYFLVETLPQKSE